MDSIQTIPLTPRSSLPSMVPRRLLLFRKHSIALDRALLLLRCSILIFAGTCLILDIISINFYLSRGHPFPFTYLLPQSTSHIPEGAYIPFVLCPDTMAVAIMSMLLWKRIRLPDRWWVIHSTCRVAFSLALVSLALVCPSVEVHYFSARDGGMAKYFCKELPFSRLHGGDAGVGNANGSGSGNGNGVNNDGDAIISPTWQQQHNSLVQAVLGNCQVMRARSILTFLWSLLVLIEIATAFQAGEFQNLKTSRNAVWTAEGSELNKQAYFSSSEVWNDRENRSRQDLEGGSQITSSSPTHSGMSITSIVSLDSTGRETSIRASLNENAHIHLETTQPNSS